MFLTNPLDIDDEFREIIKDFLPMSEREVIGHNHAVALLGEHRQYSEILLGKPHFTASGMVIFEDKVLLHKHKTLDIWCYPGGHIVNVELPHIAAIREVKEETGVDCELYNGNIEVMNIDLINSKDHQHVDLTFLFVAIKPEISIMPGESSQVGWFSLADARELSRERSHISFDRFGQLDKGSDL